jgi:chromatin segregation and condensation protein Rec8/ScpA/Scc1 (kleisin family)
MERTRTRTIERQGVSLAAQIEYVLRRVREHGTVSFIDVCRGFDRATIVVTFLAVLDLIRQVRLIYQQDGPYDDLRLLRPAVVSRPSMDSGDTSPSCASEAYARV